MAISADTPEESQELCRKAGFTFPILSDRNAQTIRSYDLLVAHAGKDDRDIAETAEFLLDSSGTVRWRKFGESTAGRFLQEAQKMN